ncbi:hypothetical protein GE265_35340 (plasmid) [Streptomyces clavuligerus]|nr:hypothetical protein GE265_35340 [Streptomyces clavuligerus]
MTTSGPVTVGGGVRIIHTGSSPQHSSATTARHSSTSPSRRHPRTCRTTRPVPANASLDPAPLVRSYGQLAGHDQAVALYGTTAERTLHATLEDHQAGFPDGAGSSSGSGGVPRSDECGPVSECGRAGSGGA